MLSNPQSFLGATDTLKSNGALDQKFLAPWHPSEGTEKEPSQHDEMHSQTARSLQVLAIQESLRKHVTRTSKHFEMNANYHELDASPNPKPKATATNSTFAASASRRANSHPFGYNKCCDQRHHNKENYWHNC
jgi:hypothetical protein